MLDLFPVELREPVWYILAGFILGFAVSTLWEWLYFRRFRVEAIDEFHVESTTGFSQRSELSSQPWPSQPLAVTPEFETATQSSAYRSPSIFLESERPSSLPQPIGAQPPGIHPTSTPAHSTAVPSIQSPTVPNVSPQTETIAHLAGEPPPEIEAEKLLPVWVPSEPTPKRNQSWVERRRDAKASADRPPIETTPVQEAGSLVKQVQPGQASSQAPTQVPTQTPPPVISPALAQTNSPTGRERVSDLETPLPPAEIGVPVNTITDTIESAAPSIPLESSSAPGRPRVPRSRGYPDDLALIKGIGETYRRRLYESKIFTFHHVAMSDIDVLRRATQAAPNANVEVWPLRAHELAQKYGRTNASYSGPLPDDLTQIPGIGPYFAQTLYRTGICTFEQLADASVEELATLFPPSVLGREISFQEWLNAAAAQVQERTTGAKA